jgi:methylase of polypeptide subunit release factors
LGKSKKILKNNGILVFECGINQYKEISYMIESSGFLSIEKVVKDLNNIERVITAKNNG